MAVLRSALDNMAALFAATRGMNIPRRDPLFWGILVNIHWTAIPNFVPPLLFSPAAGR